MSSALAPYRSLETQYAALQARGRAGEFRPHQFGESVEGRPLWALTLPGGPASVLVTANIHGPEFISGAVAWGVVDRLVANDTPEAQALRHAATVTVVPCLNPDGYQRTWDADGRGKLAELRANARGVDLNRNYPLPRGARRWPLPGAGSANPAAATYRGEAPLSEPETRALAELARELRPHLSAGLHSFMGKIIPARVTTRHHYRRYVQLWREFRLAQPDQRYGRLASRIFDVFTGEQEDYLHHELDCWSVCVETFSLRASFGQHLRAPSLFWRFNPRDPAPWVANDVPALLAYANAGLSLPRPTQIGESR